MILKRVAVASTQGLFRGRGHSRRVAGLVVSDLKAEELLNRLERLGIVSGDPDPSAPIRRLKLVVHRAAQPPQRGHPGRHPVVNQHGGVEVAGREHPGDVRQMNANQVAAGRVVRVVGLNFDRSAIWVQPEMVSSLLVGETHHLVAAPIHPFVAFVVVGHHGLILRLRRMGLNRQ